MALYQNQFAMSTVVGTKVSGTNVITVQAYDASASTAFVPGEVVKMASTTNGTVPVVQKGSAATDLYLGVILTNPVTESWVSGDKMEIALASTIVYMTASAAITAGAKLQYDYSTGKVATQTATNTVIGMALDNASGDGVLIRVYINPTWLNAGEANTMSSAGSASDGVALNLTKVVADLPIKRIKAGTGITITEQTNGITIAVS
jgi:hypothetical protein